MNVRKHRRCRKRLMGFRVRERAESWRYFQGLGFVPTSIYGKGSVSVGDIGLSGGYTVFMSPDPEVERAEFLRQLMAPVEPVEGPHRPLMRGEIGTYDGGFRIIVAKP